MITNIFKILEILVMNAFKKYLKFSLNSMILLYKMIPPKTSVDKIYNIVSNCLISLLDPKYMYILNLIFNQLKLSIRFSIGLSPISKLTK